MTPLDPEDQKDLDGLARSIGSLFSDAGGKAEEPTQQEPTQQESIQQEPTEAVRTGEEGAASSEAPASEPAGGGGTTASEAAAPEPTDDLVWEKVEEPPVIRSSGAPDPAALKEAVTAFVRADGRARDAAARHLREVARPLRETNALDPLADAVEYLALEAGDPPDEATLAMAQLMVGPGTASRLAARLGAAREERRRADLILVARRLGEDMAVAIADALSDTTDRFARRSFMETMVALGQVAVKVVEGMLEDGRWFVVRNAVAILGEVGGDRAVELLTASLAHTDARVRREALLSLAKVGGGQESSLEDAGLLVNGMIGDSDPDVRLAAVMAAGSLGVERALRPLLALLDGEDNPDLVAAILRSLGQLGDPGAVQAIEKRAVTGFFSRPPTDVRIAAYRALHAIGTPHAKSLLQEARDDKDIEVRTAVRQLAAQS